MASAFHSAVSRKPGRSSLLPSGTALGIPEYGTDTVQYCKKETDLGLTEPEEAERAYQDHFLLILCENLATPAMMGYDTRMNQCYVPSPKKLPLNQGPEEQHDSRLTTP